MLVASMNPCPCGYLTDPRKQCTCSPGDIKRNTARLSGPLLDRIDLHIEVPAVPYDDLAAGTRGETSSAMATRVAAARDIQIRRYAPLAADRTEAPRCRTNADLGGDLLETYCALDEDGRTFLGKAVTSLALSARAYTRILRIARTIADLENEAKIAVPQLAEAVNCRFLDRQGN